MEKPIADVTPKDLAELGLIATPSIVFNESVASAGIPSVEEAAGLIKRAQLDRGIQRYAIPKSKAMQNFAEGKIPTEATARALASEFYPFSEEFPLFLSAAIGHIRDDTARFLLVHNLYQEHGNLSSTDRMHPALFRAFCRGIEMEMNKLEDQNTNAPGAQAARMVMEICRDGPAHQAIAALCPIELMFGPTCDIISAATPSPDAIDYW